MCKVRTASETTKREYFQLNNWKRLHHTGSGGHWFHGGGGVPTVKALREVERSHGLDFLFGIHCFQISRHILHIYICLICQWFSSKCFKANKIFMSQFRFYTLIYQTTCHGCRLGPSSCLKTLIKGKYGQEITRIKGESHEDIEYSTESSLWSFRERGVKGRPADKGCCQIKELPRQAARSYYSKKSSECVEEPKWDL